MHQISAPDQAWQVSLHDLPGTDQSPPPRVYLHGLGASSAYFRDIVSRPEHRRARSLLIDLPGFGQSHATSRWSFSTEEQAGVVAHILDQLQMPAVDVIGHSMGGSIAIILASRYPGLVRRLVVAEPALDPGIGHLSTHIARQSESRFIERGYAALMRQVERESSRGGIGAALFLFTLRQTSPVALHRSAASLLTDREPTFRQMLESLPMPRTVIRGDRSPEINPPLSESTGIAHLTVERAGHVMMVDNLDGFTGALWTELES